MFLRPMMSRATADVRPWEDFMSRTSRNILIASLVAAAAAAIAILFRRRPEAS